MTRGDDGKLRFGWDEIGKFFLSNLGSSALSILAAMAYMYGDVREIKTNISTLKDNDNEQRVTLRDHDHRITTLEQARVEQ